AAICELQWTLSPRRFSFRLPFEEFWERAESVPIQSSPVRSFCAPDMLLTLCAHGSKHVWESLKWLMDVAELLRRYQDLDLDTVLADAARARCRRAVLLGLVLANRVLEAPVPP